MTKCSICEEPYDEDYGHNAWPINDGRCCADCNLDVVVPARIAIYQLGLEHHLDRIKAKKT
jgi:hypothetical protein